MPLAFAMPPTEWQGVGQGGISDQKSQIEEHRPTSTSYQLDDPLLCFHIRLDVPLGGRQIGMPRQHLDIPQRPAHG